MELQIPLVGVLLAAISAMVIGTAWYSPYMFGKQWREFIGLSEKDMKQRMGSAMGLMVLVSLLTAYVLAHFVNYVHATTGGSWVGDSLQTAIWAWIGFGLTTIIAHGAFEPRDKKIMIINAGNRLITLLAMGLILGLSFK